MKKPITHNYYNRPFFRADMRPDGTLELLCYEEIGENSWTGGGLTAKVIKQQIDGHKKCSDILLRINSPGGDVFEAIAIFNLLRSQNKPIEVRVDGLAASSASIIAMAGDKIIMGISAMMMVHNAWSLCMGYASDMRKMAGELDKVSGAISAIYVRRTMRSLADVNALMEAETWMTADEALAGRFATEVESEPDEQVERNALAIARRFRSLARLKHTPERFRAGQDELCACACPACLAGNCAECNNPACKDENCLDCPMQAKDGLNDLQARLEGLDLALQL